jgi:hypothetical protein
MRINFHNILILIGFIWPLASEAGQLDDYQRRIRAAGDDMLENLAISYVYGGSKVGDAATCDECNSCLEKKRPAPKQRFSECPTCQNCSLDCSHFVQLVFSRAGLGFPYLTSTQMLDLSADALLKKYSLVPVVMDLEKVVAGDMLVYRGHVVVVETVHEPGVADIIHATGGKDIKVPGQGIQRERYARLSNFRGELLRIIRHKKLNELSQGPSIQGPPPLSQVHSRLRPVEKRKP